MINQGISFVQSLNKLRLYSSLRPDIQLNCPFIYTDHNKQHHKCIVDSIQIFSERQNPMKQFFGEIRQQERVISSLKLTPQKFRIKREDEFSRVLKDIQIIPSTIKRSSRFCLNTPEQNLFSSSPKLSQTNKNIKLQQFEMTFDNQQQQIKLPKTSPRMGCNWIQKQQSLNLKTNPPNWWDKCTQLCSGQNNNLLTETDKYEVQTTQKQVRKLITNKHVPFIVDQQKNNNV